MVRNLLYLVSIILVSLLTTMCGGRGIDAEAELSGAEEALEAKEYSEARESMGALTDSAVMATLSARQLGRLGLLYMRLPADAEHDEGDNVAMGAQCFRRGYEMSADMMVALFNELGVEEQQHFVVLARIAAAIEGPGEVEDDAPEGEEMSMDSLVMRALRDSLASARGREATGQTSEGGYDLHDHTLPQ